MLKIAVGSVALLLLLSGCGEKKEQKSATSSASMSVAQSSVSSVAVKSVADCLPGTECDAPAPASSVKAEMPPPLPVAMPKAADGAKLYAKCASCHGPKGERKALGKSAIIAGMAKDEVLKKLKDYQAGSLNQYGMGALMKGQLAGLKEADLEALADYIFKLK